MRCCSRSMLCCSMRVLVLQVAAIPVKSKKTLARAVELCRKAKVIAVDCEGSKLSAEGKLCLVQVSSRYVLWLHTGGIVHRLASESPAHGDCLTCKIESAVAARFLFKCHKAMLCCVSQAALAVGNLENERAATLHMQKILQLASTMQMGAGCSPCKRSRCQEQQRLQPMLPV